MNAIYTIRELKELNESEMMKWIVSANAYDLGLVLKNERIKGVSKMKKAEKVAMVVRLAVENGVIDEDTKIIMEKVKKLHDEIEVRQSYGEKIEWTLYAMYKNKEITYNELRKVCNAYRMDIPISINENNSIRLVRKYCSISKYEQRDYDGNVYYSILDKKYEWDNLYRKNSICNDWGCDVKKFYEMNTVDKNGLQLAYTFDGYGYYTLCVYKDHELLGVYGNYNIAGKINELVDYDDKLVADDLDTYNELLELLNKQYKDYWRFIEAYIMLRKKLNMTEISRKSVIYNINKSMQIFEK